MLKSPDSKSNFGQLESAAKQSPQLNCTAKIELLRNATGS